MERYIQRWFSLWLLCIFYCCWKPVFAWEGAQNYSSVLFKTLTSTYQELPGSVTVTLSNSTQKVLLLANGLFVPDAVDDAVKFNLARDGTELGNYALQAADAESADGLMPVAMTFLDSPGVAGTYTYAPLAEGNAGRAFARLTAVLISGHYSTAATSSTTPITVVSHTTYTTIDEVAAVLTDTSEKVLLNININYQNVHTGQSYCKFYLFRGTTQIAKMQELDVYSKDHRHAATITYVDTPYTTGTITYYVKGLTRQSGDLGCTISSNSMTRQCSSIVIPGYMSTDIHSDNYNDIGDVPDTDLERSITTVNPTDQVLITYLGNFSPTSPDGAGAITLKRDGTDLGVTSSGEFPTTGLQTARSENNWRSRIMNFYYLDEPGAAATYTYVSWPTKIGTHDWRLSDQSTRRQLAVTLVSSVLNEPSPVPTNAPTESLTDCTSSCEFLATSTQNYNDLASSGSGDIVVGKAIAVISLSINFEMKFDVVIPDSLEASPSVQNMIDIADKESDETLVSVSLAGDTGVTQLVYGGTTLTSVGPPLKDSHDQNITTFSITHQSGTVSYSSSKDNLVFSWSTGFTEVDTTSSSYILYISSPDTTAGSSSGGSISNIQFTGFTGAPSLHPTASPTLVPTAKPTVDPTLAPTASPTLVPTAKPTVDPTLTPTASPTLAPTAKATVAPTLTPTASPTLMPTIKPTASPTLAPTHYPTSNPSSLLSSQPSSGPTSLPSSDPSSQPSAFPSSQPSSQPSANPSSVPSAVPSTQPSSEPSGQPTGLPSSQPTSNPSTRPSSQPSSAPSSQPTSIPSGQPSSVPSMQPSCQPSSFPSGQPSIQPTTQPTRQPTSLPSSQPSAQPSTYPSCQPSCQPSAQPSGQPTSRPSSQPSDQPTSHPSAQPSNQPSLQPSAQPSTQPSFQPSCQPTNQPTTQPTVQPSCHPTRQPTNQPSVQPSTMPSSQPSRQPSTQPSTQPSGQPTCQPSEQPSSQPTGQPSTQPSSQPSTQPTSQPSSQPSEQPSTQPSCQPSSQPTVQPSAGPTAQPSIAPTGQPTSQPSDFPSSQPTSQPSMQPSRQPIDELSGQPSGAPSSSPSTQPTAQPSSFPSAHPTHQPSSQPSSGPTALPSSRPSCAPSPVPTPLPTVLPVAPALLAINATTEGVPAPKYQIRVDVELEKGYISSVTVHCAAFASFAPPPTTVNAVLLQRFSALTSSGFASLVISSLNPATSYNVYCVAEGVTGVMSTIGSVLAKRADVTTECCRLITPSLSVSSLLPGDVALNALSIAVDSPPSEMNGAVVVTPRAVLVVENTTNGDTSSSSTTAVILPSFYPDSVVFTNVSTVLSTAVTIVAPANVVLGYYNIELVLSGVSGPAYEVLSQRESSRAGVATTASNATSSESSSSSSSSTGIVFSVSGLDAVPAAPQLISAVFGTDGSWIEVTFDAATNKAGYSNAVDCSTLFAPFVSATTTSGSSDSSTCQWRDANVLLIYPGVDLLVNDTITLLSDNNVRAACSGGRTAETCASWPVAASASVFLEAPVNSISPLFTLSMPNVISACAPLTVELSAFSGSGGRPWAAPVFEVASSVDPSAAASIAQFLNANFSNVLDPSWALPSLSVPSSLFPTAGPYTIGVTLCNFLRACSQDSAVVVYEFRDRIPIVTVPGQRVRTTTAGRSLVIGSTAYTLDCNDTKSYANLLYSWSVYDQDQEVLRSDIQSVSPDPSILRLPAYTLAPLQTYRVLLEVTEAVSGITSSASVTVFVAQAAVVAQITGGELRRILIGDFPLVLDASSSYDEDISGLTGSAAGLSFAWSCIQISPTFSTSCPMHTSSSTSSTSTNDDGDNGQNPGAGFLTLTAGLTAINTTVRISVTVSDSSTGRSSTTSVLVQAQDSSSPLVSILSSVQSVTAVNVNKELQLSGEITVQSPCEAAWVVDDPSIDLEANALTAVRAVPIPMGTTQVLNLVLQAHALLPRSTLTFSLVCGDSEASIAVTTNDPPMPGLFRMSPSSGVELTTSFTFMTSVWSSDHLPISYQFGFLSVTTGAKLVLQSRSESSSASSTLPAGPIDAQYALVCFAQIFDALDAVYEGALQTVHVTPKVNTTQLQSFVIRQLISSTGNNDARKGAISVSIAVMNSVSCELTPNCSLLNRHDCAKVADTCGSCFSGYVGEAGDSNMRCVDPTLLQEQQPSSSSINNGSCLSDADCSGWETCFIDNSTSSSSVGYCTVLQKSCPNNCSGEGNCVTLHKHTRQPVSDCKVSDAMCVAECDCFVTSNFTGLSCATHRDTLLVKQALREELITTLVDVTLSDDLNDENIASWSSSLSALTQDPSELPASSVETVGALARSILTSATALQTTPYAAAVGTLDAMEAAAVAHDRVVAAAGTTTTAGNGTTSTATDNLVSLMLETVSLFTSLVESQLIAGQSDVSYVYGHFRFNSVRETLTMGNGSIATTVPHTVHEQQGSLLATASSPSDVRIADASDAEEEFALNIIMTAVSSYGALASSTFASNPIRLALSRANQTRDSTHVLVEFIHNNPIEFTNDSTAASWNLTTTCSGGIDFSLHEYTCPQSGARLVHNCSGLAGVLTSYCPILSPSCDIVNASSATAVRSATSATTDGAANSVTGTGSGSGTNSGVGVNTTVTAASGCSVVSFDAYSTTCSCQIEADYAGESNVDVAGAGRKLYEKAIRSASMDMVASSLYLASNFKDTFNSADDFDSLEDLKAVMIVIIMFSTLWSFGLLLILGCTWRRQVKQKHHSKDKIVWSARR